ncbi:MAG: hypothetical protein IVW52_04780 [Acidimicrobiales bacterium]|nr:hypothetical protein [Acidimicrobiales bacterium]
MNLGCANRPLPGYVNLDAQDLPGVDMVYEVDPWRPVLPFESDSVEEIYSNNFNEHIANTVALINEFGRVSVEGARWFILTPGYLDLNSWRDPGHLSHYEERCLDFWTEEGFDNRHYTDRFRITYTLDGDNEHGLEFHVVVHKPPRP